MKAAVKSPKDVGSNSKVSDLYLRGFRTETVREFSQTLQSKFAEVTIGSFLHSFQLITHL
jgi:hypothetical protein